MAETRFDTCLAAVLVQEGGFSDHPCDPGGATNMGITLKTLANWRAVSPWWALPKSEVKALGRAEAAKIYRSNYWNVIKADSLPVGLDLAMFDFAVNSGPDRAVRMLQGLLKVAADGQIGPLTLSAIKAEIGLRGVAGLIDALCDRRLDFLTSLATFPVFGNGWKARVAAIRKAALTVAQATQSTDQRSTTMTFLTGFRTYIIAALMLLAGIAQVLGIPLPTLDGASSGHLIMEALAVIFLRKGIKNDVGGA